MLALIQPTYDPALKPNRRPPVIRIDTVNASYQMETGQLLLEWTGHPLAIDEGKTCQVRLYQDTPINGDHPDVFKGHLHLAENCFDGTTAQAVFDPANLAGYPA